MAGREVGAGSESVRESCGATPQRVVVPLLGKVAAEREGAETAMVVGVLQMRLLVREATTLKDKRRVVKSLRDRLRHEFNVSASETGALDLVQTAVLGVAVVTNDGAFADQVLAKVVDFVRRSPAELVRYETELISSDSDE